MYIQRHGESEANAQRIYSCLKVDPQLTADGRKQIEFYLDYYSQLDIDNIISSPSTRAIQTAEIISNHIGLSISIDNKLHEVIMGDLEGLPQDDKENISLFESILANWFKGDKSKKFPNGESYYDVKARIDHVAKYYFDQKNTLLVAHATFFACMIAETIKYNESVFELFLPRAGRGKYENGKWIMIDTR